MAEEDRILIDRIKDRDQLAYAKLMEKYKRSIFFTVLKMVNNKDDADDLTMEAFTKAFRNLENYDYQYAFSTWLFKIATNNTIDFIRKKRLLTTSLDKKIGSDDDDNKSSGLGDLISDDKLGPEEEFIKKQRSKLMRELVQELNPKYRELIELRFFKEKKYEEIAKDLNVPLGTVKVRLSRAKDLLAKILEENKGRY